MSKTQMTLDMEEALYNYSLEQGEVVVEEVSVPDAWGRVDTLACRKKADVGYEWRCYEIKASRSDFRSKSLISFVGNYNYYVMPQALYDRVKGEIPKHVGVICYIPFATEIIINDVPAKGSLAIIKKASRQELLVAEDELMFSFLHSLFREVRKAKKMEKGLHLFSDWELHRDLIRRHQGSINKQKDTADLLDTFVKVKEMEERAALLEELALTKSAYDELLFQVKANRRKTEAIL